MHGRNFFSIGQDVITKFKLDFSWIISDNKLVFCGKHDKEADSYH